MKRLFFLLAFFAQFSVSQADTITTFDFYINDSFVQNAFGYGEHEVLDLHLDSHQNIRIQVNFGCIPSKNACIFLCKDTLPAEWLTCNSAEKKRGSIDLHVPYHIIEEKKLTGLMKVYYFAWEPKEPYLAFKLNMHYE